MISQKYWTPEGFEVSTYQWRLCERKNLTTNISNTDGTGKCYYIYNELGFRGDSPDKEGFKVMSIGCSNTEGVGVDNHETWPAQFCKLVPNSVNLNFGHGGRSNDYIARCLISYYDLIKPDLVLIMYTEGHRREFFTEEGGIEPFHAMNWGYFKDTEKGLENYYSLINLSNKEVNFQNWYKNHLLIKYFLEVKKCNWVWNAWFTSDDHWEDNRFDGDYYPHIDLGVDGMHPGPETQRQYAKKLHSFILEKYPHFILPYKTDIVKKLI